jgi:autotransporter-associated beta strand protein
VMDIVGTSVRRCSLISVCATAALFTCCTPALGQRLLGIDISAWQDGIDQNPSGPNNSDWQTLYNTNNRKFAFIRSSRGGTTGFDHDNDNILSSNADCNGVSTRSCLSNRYDDPYFGQNITRATQQGLFAGSYHRSQAQIIASTPNSGGIANTGTDEANHMIQMAGPWMRPGYLPPMLDFEDGVNERSGEESAQFALDFSNRIYAVMQIRPGIYFNGVYANELSGGTSTQRSELAQQSSDPPSVVSPAFPTLWNARWPNQTNPNLIDVQNEQPKDTASHIYGSWDDYGVEHPWAFWQYASTAKLSGYKNGTTNIDVDVSHGDIEFVKDQLVPALWWNDTSGDWSTLTNWNSGQPAVAPPVVANMTPVQGTTTLPTPRLPGAAGSGPTSGQNDTVILERPDANITVTLSTGTHNVRKLYMRETLNITGGSLNINYDPNYAVPVDVNGDPIYPNALRSGPISAQFSGPVSLSGSGSLSVHTVQLDAAQTFTLAGGTLTFNKINLISNSATKINVTGDVNINPLNNATATITRTGSTGSVDLTGGTRQFTVGNGSADVDLSVAVPITNGGLTKAGAGTMKLDGANTFAGNVTIHGGTLRYGDASGLASASLVTVNDTGRLEMNGVSDTIAGLASNAGHTTGVVQQGAANLTVAASSGDNTYSGTITGSGTFTKDGAATQRLNGINTLGAVVINSGSLLFLKNNTTGNVTVNGGTLGGTGSVSGAVTVNSGAHLSPGASVESLGVGSLTLNAGSVLDIEIETIGVNDLINVAGLLTLNGGSINVSMAEGGEFFPGVYPIIDYETLNGSLASLGTPIGPEGFDYELVTTGSRLDLVVSVAGIPGDFNDDGAVDAMDYIIWKKLRDTEADLPNDGDLPGPIGSAHYALWQQNFGRSEGDGGGQGGSEVPEPAAAVLIVLGMVGFAAIRRGR